MVRGKKFLRRERQVREMVGEGSCKLVLNEWGESWKEVTRIRHFQNQIALAVKKIIQNQLVN